VEVATITLNSNSQAVNNFCHICVFNF